MQDLETSNIPHISLGGILLIIAILVPVARTITLQTISWFYAFVPLGIWIGYTIIRAVITVSRKNHP